MPNIVGVRKEKIRRLAGRVIKLVRNHLLWLATLSTVLLLLPCVLLLGQGSLINADAGPREPEKWHDVRRIGDSICDEKKEILLSPDKARQMFTKDPPHIKDAWQNELEERVEPAPKTVHLPERSTFLELPEKMRRPYAEVVRFSQRQVVVMVLERRGNYLWHQYLECLAAFRMPRDPQVDELFGVDNLDRLYASRCKGIASGDSEKTVLKTLGEPDLVESWQPIGYFRYSYFADDVAIQFQDFRVKTIQHGIPPSLKKEAKQKGKRITRA